MDIAVANQSDIEELTQVEIASKKKSFPEGINGNAVDYPSGLCRWNTYFKGNSPQTSKLERIVLKATIDNHMIGYLAGHLTNRFEKDAEIQSFYLLKQYQRQGIGTKLLLKFTKWLSLQQAKSVCVGIAPNNKYQAFYLKHGGKYLNEHWIYWSNIHLVN